MSWYVALPLMTALVVGYTAFGRAAKILGGPSATLLPSTKGDVADILALVCAMGLGFVLARWVA